MPRNNRRPYYNRKFDLRMSAPMAERLERLARRRNRPLAQIVRLATEAGLREMEANVAKESEVPALKEGQRARISGMNTPLTTPEQKFEGLLATVSQDEESNWTYAAFVGDAPYDMIVVKLDEKGELQGSYNLEVEEKDANGTPYWRMINGTTTQT
jgi:predicted DNA-binding protein